MELKKIYNEYKKLENKEIEITARVRSNRVGKNISFIVLNDGTTINDLQVVYKGTDKFYEDLSKCRIGAVITVKGKLVLTPKAAQPFEVQAISASVDSPTDENYILQKKEHSFEFLREIAHLRPRTKTFQAIYKLRSSIFFSIHEYFMKNDYVSIQTPIITGNDAEGGGEAFVVTTLEKSDYENDFFGKKASLTVSGQLHSEAMTQAFNKIYTFGPTFRAEKSNTTKHAAEFWMFEMEAANFNLVDIMRVMEDLLKHVIDYIFKNNLDELKYCDENIENGLIEKLKSLRKDKFAVIEYTEAVKILSEAVKKGHKFENTDIKFGLDLGTEHERYICEVHSKKPTFLINYPKEIKAFYMKQNDDGKTVAAVDLLVPYIGELVGGSVREDSKEKILQRCKELKINADPLSWYIDLREEGYYKTAGFGLGLDRLIMYFTGSANIRDVQMFPRTLKNLLF